MSSILTVLDEASNYDLISRDELKRLLSITGATEDENLASWISQASAAIATHCDRVFHSEKVQEVFRRDRTNQSGLVGEQGPEKLVLNRYPVIDIVSVAESSDELDGADFEVDPKSGLLYRLCNDDLSRWSASKTTVIYQAGFDPIPPDVVKACVLLVSQARSSAKRDPAVKAIEVFDVDRVEYWVGAIGDGKTNFPPEVVTLLDRYIRTSVG